MNLGFDAKRAFHNRTGLGHYSRNLIRGLSHYFPQHEYFLFNPKSSGLFQFEEINIHEIRPHGIAGRLFPSAWRTTLVNKDLKRLKIDLYHGLSHELPLGIRRAGIPCVVTMHDLIHERYPEQYSPVDVRIYRRKFRYACANADRIIAISHQTGKDLVDIYGIAADKIVVCYQSCNPAFAGVVSDEEKKMVRMKYSLPDQFFLYVGSVIERKNLLGICKALIKLRSELSLPLVVIGEGGKYLQQVKDFIKQQSLEKRIIFLSENEVARKDPEFLAARNFPAIYQSAVCMVYPSFFEGFGIPVLEALCSRLPVVTSNLSSLPEAGGDAAYYVNPSDEEDLARGMKAVYSDQNLAEKMKEKGWAHAQKFTTRNTSAAVMDVYGHFKS